MWALNYHYYGSNKIPLTIVLWNIWLDWQELCVGTMQMSQSTCYAISDKWRFLCGHYIAVDSVRLDTVLIALSTLLLSTFLCGRHCLSGYSLLVRLQPACQATACLSGYSLLVRLQPACQATACLSGYSLLVRLQPACPTACLSGYSLLVLQPACPTACLSYSLLVRLQPACPTACLSGYSLLVRLQPACQATACLSCLYAILHITTVWMYPISQASNDQVQSLGLQWLHESRRHTRSKQSLRFQFIDIIHYPKYKHHSLNSQLKQTFANVLMKIKPHSEDWR